MLKDVHALNRFEYQVSLPKNLSYPNISSLSWWKFPLVLRIQWGLNHLAKWGFLPPPTHDASQHQDDITFLGYTSIEARAVFWGVMNLDVWSAFDHNVVQALCSNFFSSWYLQWFWHVGDSVGFWNARRRMESLRHFSQTGKPTI